jgi:MYXO-CTERM domain-containing protein
MKGVFALVLATSTLIVSRPSRACSPLGNVEHDLDPAYVNDTVAPSAPVVTLGDVAPPPRRPTGGGCGSSYVELVVEATDDRAPANGLGYDVTILTPDTPLNDDTRIVRGFGGHSLYVGFTHVPDDLTGFQLDVEVRAVDLNGNVGEPTAFSTYIELPALVVDEDDGGCSAGGASPGWLGLAALALLRRRRR